MSWRLVHHLAIHAPIALPLAVAAFAWIAERDQSARARLFARLVGWFTFGAAALAATSGWIAAEQIEGAGAHLAHHRYLGISALALSALAALSYERGCRGAEERDWRAFGAGLWCVTAFGAWGAGHWGGLGSLEGWG